MYRRKPVAGSSGSMTWQQWLSGASNGSRNRQLVVFILNVLIKYQKKWKDRYALVSVHVLKSVHDALLKWPCHIEGSVTLRDQENLENAKNFSKRIETTL